MDLTYINSNLDMNGNRVAFLDADTYEKLFNGENTVYIWIKDINEKIILKGIKLDLRKALKEEDIQNTETITTRINVEIADSQENTTTIRDENVDGVQEKVAVGYVKIKDDESATYYYERVKLPASEEYNQLMLLAEQIKEEYDTKNMYEKSQMVIKFNSIYSKLIKEANWQEVENMIIQQPEDSKENDKYIVLLKKVDTQGKITTDAQFLTSFEAYEPNVEKQEVVIQETSKLPVTYDSMGLFVILAVIGSLMIIIFIKMKKIKQK